MRQLFQPACSLHSVPSCGGHSQHTLWVTELSPSLSFFDAWLSAGSDFSWSYSITPHSEPSKREVRYVGYLQVPGTGRVSRRWVSACVWKMLLPFPLLQPLGHSLPHFHPPPLGLRCWEQISESMETKRRQEIRKGEGLGAVLQILGKTGRTLPSGKEKPKIPFSLSLAESLLKGWLLSGGVNRPWQGQGKGRCEG